MASSNASLSYPGASSTDGSETLGGQVTGGTSTSTSNTTQDTSKPEVLPASVESSTVCEDDSTTLGSGSSVPDVQSEGILSDPGLQIIYRMKNLPISQCAAGVYDTAMGYVVFEKVVSTGRFLTVIAASPMLLMCSPFVKLCDAPMQGVDWLLCKGLDAAETVFPCVAMPPAKVCGAVKTCATNCVCCVPRVVSGATSRLCSTATATK